MVAAGGAGVGSVPLLAVQLAQNAHIKVNSIHLIYLSIVRVPLRHPAQRRLFEPNNSGPHLELTGTVSNRSGTCPTITFAVQGTTVSTNGNTKLEDGSCAQVVNGIRVEVEGTRQANNTFLAKEVEID